MINIPNPEDVTTTQAAEILLAHGWEVYPDALPYGGFFIIPRADGYHEHQVACLAYCEFYKKYNHPDPKPAPVQMLLFEAVQ